MRLSIVGPMTGKPDWNHSQFREAARTLREAGHDVFNPAETFGGDTSYPRSAYMRASIGALLQTDAVVTLEGWETSPGSKTEVRVALALGLPVFSFEGLMSDSDVMDFYPDAPDD